MNRTHAQSSQEPFVHAWMDPDMELFRQQVRRYIDREFSPQLAQWREQGFVPREVWAPFAAQGFLMPELEEAHGGAGASRAHQIVVQDELARAEMPANTAVHNIATHYIAEYGTPEQRARWLPGLASGALLAAIAMTEPGCGSDLQAMRTRARRDGGDYIIDGSKTFITNGYTANLVVLAARTGEAGARGVSLLVLETEGLQGFKVGRRLEKIGQHASDTAELHFSEVWVPADHLLGAVEGQGFAQLMGQLPYERLLLAVAAVAVMERALELTLEHVRQRQAFGQPLLEFQNTRFKVAECATTTRIARSFINECTQRLIDGTLDASTAYMAKWWCTEQQGRVLDECLQLFGGYGYMAEYPIARMYADARVQRIYGGTTEIMKELIARGL